MSVATDVGSPTRPNVPESTTKSPAKFSSRVLSIDARMEALITKMNATRPTPIISAWAVADVRRGFRPALSRARRPATPRSRATGAPSTLLTGRANPGLTSTSAANIRTAPRPTLAGSSPRAPAITMPTPRASTTTPTMNRTSERPDRSTATSRRAASGGTREARQAGRSAEKTVTSRPVTIAVTTDVGRIASEPGGSCRKELRNEASPNPARKPISEPVEPTTRASTRTARRTWRRARPDGPQQRHLAGALGDDD